MFQVCSIAGGGRTARRWSSLRKSNLSLREERRKAREEKARLDADVAALKVPPRCGTYKTVKAMHKKVEATYKTVKRMWHM